MKASKSPSSTSSVQVHKLFRRSEPRITRKVGLPPGSIVYTGIPKDRSTRITLLKYNDAEAGFDDDVSFDQLKSRKNDNMVTWINFDSLHDVDLMARVGEYFTIHNLTMEDIVHVGHRPKMEEYGEYLFMMMNIIKPEEETGNLHVEQISFVLMNDTLLSFQEHKGDPFDGIRDRIMTGKGKARGRGPDYLLFLLIDAIIDQYLLSVEAINNEIAGLEMQILEKPEPHLVNRIVEQKKTISELRKIIYPVRDALKEITTGETEFIREDYFNYYNDVYDHLKQIIDHIDNQRDSLTSLMEFYMSQVSNQMNKVMQMLTIVATIFIPLTFLAGLYGMNFRYMPELEWKWSYPILLATMLVLGVGMYLYMRRKRWF